MAGAESRGERGRGESRPTRAVVLSGGGADGAYGVGVLEALVAGRSPATGYQPLAPDLLSGTSIGSFNAAFLVSHWDELGPGTVERLSSIWRENLARAVGACANGAYRIKAAPTTYLNPRCYLPNPLSTLAQLANDGAALGWEGLQRLVRFAGAEESLLQRTVELLSFSTFVSRDPWGRTIRQTIDFASIRRSSKLLRIVATNWATGSLKIFDNHAMSDTLGPLAIEASSALPGFFPPAVVGSQPFLDGGILLNTPLRPAIRAGGQELFVIYLDPDISALPLAQYENTLATLYRSQQIAWAAKMELDIGTARGINNVLRWIERARELGDTEGPFFRHMEKRYDRYLPLTIHRFSPAEDLGGALGLLDLDVDRIDRLIRQGHDDAAVHDCEAAGCVLVGDQEVHEPPF